MDSYKIKSLIVLTFITLLPQLLFAAPLWLNLPDKPGSASPIHSRQVAADYTQLKSSLSAANLPVAGQVAKISATAQIELPMPDGSQQLFNIIESPIMAPALAEKFPQIKTYKAVAENDASISGRLDIGPNGFHGYLFTPEGEVFIDPIPGSAQQQYYSYYKHDYVSKAATEFSCGVKTKTGSIGSVADSPLAEFKNSELLTAAKTGGANDFLTYRIAVAATGEYTQQVAGGNATTAFTEITTAISRITAIYERDLAIRLQLVSGTDIIYTNAATDPYTDPIDQAVLLDENQATLDSVIGEANYDIGHLFHTDPGGLAVLAAACFSGYKAQGYSGLTNPTGDPFYIDIVAHEIGHQLGANHSFNGTTGSCAGNRNAGTAFEPGSASTIMGYAGLCYEKDQFGTIIADENIALASDAMFHAGSIAEIVAYTRTGGGWDCPVKTTAPAAPVANAGQDYVIPGGTAFTLTGFATGAVSYQWDQMDVGTATSAATHGTDNGSNALFRSYLPVAIPERTFPVIATQLGTNPDPLAAKAETLPTENRTLNFRLTARDGNGGVGEDDMQVSVDGSKGPFEVLQPNTNVILDSSQLQSIQWNAACTEVAPVNCANVDILYSTDNGASFTPLISSTPNDGEEPVDFANVTAVNVRVKVACSDNIFFDLSDQDFTLSNIGGTVLPATVIGGSYDCGTASGTGVTGNDIEPNNTITQAQPLTFPSTINGSVNNILDPDDFFVFVANPVAYSFTLSNYGSNDLDLYLLDADGKMVVKSDSYNPIETINIGLIAGRTYYLVVNGFQTSGNDASYTLSAQEIITLPGGDGSSGAISYCWLMLMLMSLLFRQRLKLTPS